MGNRFGRKSFRNPNLGERFCVPCIFHFAQLTRSHPPNTSVFLLRLSHPCTPPFLARPRPALARPRPVPHPTPHHHRFKLSSRQNGQKRTLLSVYPVYGNPRTGLPRTFWEPDRVVRSPLRGLCVQGAPTRRAFLCTLYTETPERAF